MTDREALAGALAFVNRCPEAAEEQARALLEKYRTLDRALDSGEELLRGSGLSSAAALMASAVPGLARRLCAEQITGRMVIARLETARPLMESIYLGKRQEELYLLALNREYELLAVRQILRGTLCEVNLSSRLIVEAAMETRAERIVLCHNHPAGSCRFSMADVATMRRFLPLMARLGIPVVDHLLYAGTSIRSMRAEGRLEESLWMAEGLNNLPREIWLA